MSADFTGTDHFMKTGNQDGVFPSASLLVAKSGKPVFRNFYGNCSEKTVFDIASLTKPAVTSTLMMVAVSEGLINLNDCVTRFLPERDHLKLVKIGNLLNHSSGLPGWRPYFQEVPHDAVGSIAGRHQVIDEVLNESLEYETGSKSLYGDLSFIILDVILETVFAEPLITLVDELIARPLGMKNSFYRIVKKTPWSNESFLPAYETEQRDFAAIDFAPTEDCPWRGEIIRGYVHDQNCYSMGGVSGHAGLFSTVDDLNIFITRLISSLKGGDGFLKTEVVKQFIDPYTSSLAFHNPGTFLLGWDRPDHPNSQSGHCFTKDAIGHLGYTGCSMWIEPAKDFWVILLTNRIHPTATNEKIKSFRPALHDQIFADLGEVK